MSWELVALGYIAVGGVFAYVTGAFSFWGWLRQGFIAFDQLANWFITPFNKSAWADETMSARAYRARRDGRVWGVVTEFIINILFIWQGPGHCERAYGNERKREHSPPEMR